MKKTLTFIAVLGAALALTTVSSAQEAGPKGGAPKAGKAGQRGQGGQRGGMARMNQEIFAKLNLTDAQKRQVRELSERHAKAVRELRQQNPNADRQTLGPKFREIQKRFREDLAKILTPAQREQFKKLRKAQMEKRREQRAKRNGGAGGGLGV